MLRRLGNKIRRPRGDAAYFAVSFLLTWPALNDAVNITYSVYDWLTVVADEFWGKCLIIMKIM